MHNLPDFRRISHLIALTALVAIPWLFSSITSHTIIFKTSALGVLTVAALACQWAHGFRREAGGVEEPPWERLLSFALMAAGGGLLYLTAWTRTMGLRDAGWMEIATDLSAVLVIVLLAVPLFLRLWRAGYGSVLAPVAVWVLVQLAAALMARDLVKSASTLRELSLYPALGLVVLDLVAEPGRARLFVRMWVLTAISLGVYGFVQSQGLDFFEWNTWAEGTEGQGRITGSLGNPNFFGGYLVTVLPLCLAAAMGFRRRFWQVACLLAVAVGLWSLFHTRAVGAILGMAVGLWALLLLAFPLLGREGRWLSPEWSRRLVRAGLVLTAAGVLLLPVGVMAIKDRLPVGEAKKTSWASRYWMWVGAAHMTADRPILGFGPGGFERYFPDYRPKELTKYLPPDRHRVSHAHSEYFEMASENGILGVLVFFWLIAAFARMGYRSLRERCTSETEAGAPSMRSWETWVLAGGLASLTGVLAHNIVSVSLRWTAQRHAFWCLLALLSLGAAQALRSARASAGPVPEVRSRWPSPVAGLAVLLAATSSLVFESRLLMADIYLNQGKALLTAQLPNDAVSRFQRSLRYNARNVTVRYYLGSAYFDTQMYEQSLEEYRAVQRDGGNFVNVIFNQATVLQRLRRFDDAIQVYEAALKSDPGYARLHDYLARACYQKAIRAEGPEAEALRETCRREFRTAADLNHEAIQHSPWSAVLHKDYGFCLLMLGEFKEAEAVLAYALELDPQVPKAADFLRHARKAAELEEELGKDRVLDLLMEPFANGA